MTPDNKAALDIIDDKRQKLSWNGSASFTIDEVRIIEKALTTPAANTGDVKLHTFQIFRTNTAEPISVEGETWFIKESEFKAWQAALAPRQDDEFLRKLIDVVQCDWGRGFPGRREQDAYIAKAKDVFAGKIKLENNDEEAPRQVEEPDPDYMCPNCVTPWKCNGPHIEPADAPRQVDVGGLKRKEYGGIAKKSINYTRGWNDCIDYLAQHNLLAAAKTGDGAKALNQEQKKVLSVLAAIPVCFDAINQKCGRSKEIAQIQYCTIHEDGLRKVAKYFSTTIAPRQVDVEALLLEVRKDCPKGFYATQEEVINYLHQRNLLTPAQDVDVDAFMEAIADVHSGNAAEANALYSALTANGYKIVKVGE